MSRQVISLDLFDNRFQRSDFPFPILDDLMGYILPLGRPNSLRMPHLARFKKRYCSFLFVNLLGKFVEEFSPLGFR